MNVIVIVVDTLRWDHLGYNGNKQIRTPAIDAFARRAAIFDRAYVASFPTVPMRTDCFTGNCNFPRYGWKKLGEDEVLLTEVLREAGYYTGLVLDTTNMVPTDFPRGFHEVHVIEKPPTNTTDPETIVHPVDPKNIRQGGKQRARQMANMSHFRHEEDWFVARTMCTACQWLQENYKRERFFLWVDTFEVHEVWYTPEYYVEMYDPGYEGLDYDFPNYGYADIYTEKELNHMRAHYMAEVTLTDRWVGHLLRQIEVMGLLENTMVVFLSDHGMSLGEHNRTGKHTVDPSDPWPIYEEVARIPLLVHIPGLTRPAQHISALAQPADLMPTILDVCGVVGPETYGRSWVPLIIGETSKNWDYVFTSIHNGGGEGDIPIVRSYATVTSQRWSYIAAQEGHPPELYDLRADPGQLHNIAREHPDVARRMQEELVRFLREQGAKESYVALYEGQLAE